MFNQRDGKVITVPAPRNTTAIVTQNYNSRPTHSHPASIIVTSAPVRSFVHQNGTRPNPHMIFSPFHPGSSQGTTQGQTSSAPVHRHP